MVGITRRNVFFCCTLYICWDQEPHKFVETFRNGLGMSTGAISVQSEYGLKRFLPFYDANGKFAKKFEETKKDMQKQVEDPSLQNRMNMDEHG